MEEEMEEDDIPSFGRDLRALRGVDVHGVGLLFSLDGFAVVGAGGGSVS